MHGRRRSIAGALVKRGVHHRHGPHDVGGRATRPAALATCHGNEERNLKMLVDEGFGKNIFLSNDWYFGISIAPAGFMKEKDPSNPDEILFANRKAVPYLRQIGATDQRIRMVTVENPRRFFGA
jgi:predicted metal-dependent phosphotriesterase family hydrolase